jgi:hypothetical protein
LLIDFEEPLGLIRYVGLQNYLSDKIGERVDLVTKSGFKPRISGHILKGSVTKSPRDAPKAKVIKALIALCFELIQEGSYIRASGLTVKF